MCVWGGGLTEHGSVAPVDGLGWGQRRLLGALRAGGRGQRRRLGGGAGRGHGADRFPCRRRRRGELAARVVGWSARGRLGAGVGARRHQPLGGHDGLFGRQGFTQGVPQGVRVGHKVAVGLCCQKTNPPPQKKEL